MGDQVHPKEVLPDDTVVPITRDMNIEAQDVLMSPELWPTYPYLRVERRTEARPGQATCFIKVSDKQEVEPRVLATHQWPPPDEGDIATVLDLPYERWDQLEAGGWKPVLPNWMHSL
jgi:hypothetical protein